jgi:hypothetical protein
MMIELITQLMSYNNPHVKELAVLIEDIEYAIKNKLVSQTEYVDLMVDAERLRMVIQGAQDAALDKLVHQAIEGLITLAETMKP